MNDVYMHEFVKTCDVCQSTSGAKFMKTVAPLHPIPRAAAILSSADIVHIAIYRDMSKISRYV